MFSGTPPEFIKISPASLTALLALCGFTVALVVFLAFFINNDSWSFRLPECSEPRTTTPSVLQIQVLDDCDNSAREVTVSSEKNPWINELVDALRKIQAKVDGSVPPGDVVVDPEKNKWINDLVEALQQIQAKVNGGVSNVTLDPEQNKWVNELVDALQQIQAKLNGPDGNVTLDPQQNPWINDLIEALEANRFEHEVNVAVDLEKPAWADDLVAALHGVVELRAIDPAIRVEVRKHMACGENQRLTLSDVIRFPIGTSSLEGAAPDRIDNFLCRVGDRATGWRIFGFASGEGGKDMNQKLSRQRACQVSKYICEKRDCESCGIDCGKLPEGGEAEVAHTCAVPDGNPKSDLFIHPLGEEHFINGVADSRSAVIAACLGETTGQNVRPCGH